ncbi:MAG TPA: YdcF family protein [Magnetospirillum sp.]|nr:YdcF family protein [Magnetospirillum sp.]
MRPRAVWWLVAGVLLAMVAAVPTLMALAPSVLVAETALSPADALVVLGGDPQSRTDRAIALYRDGLAETVIVSGQGDCGEMAERLLAAGVPADVVVTECGSRNTAENAALSAEILRDSQARSVIVVTSWFHTRRALGCFIGAVPDMRVMVDSAQPPPGFMQSLASPDRAMVLAEFAKSLWYRVAHRGLCRPEEVP